MGTGFASLERSLCRVGRLARPGYSGIGLAARRLRPLQSVSMRGAPCRARVMIRARCAECGGHGTVGFYECWYCEGHGAVMTEYPVEVSVPPGTQDGDAVRIPLAQFGIENFYLTLLFRVSSAAPLNRETAR